MANLNSAADVIQLLRDIEARSQQGGLRLSQHNGNQSTWTAIDFKIAEQRYLVPLIETREIFPIPSQITPVPKAKSWVHGIANLRGELLPLFDLKYFLYNQATKVTKHSRVLVINHQDLYSGVIVDGVIGLKHFQTKPDLEADITDSAISPYLNGNISHQEMSWDVFSFKKLATDQRFINAAQ